MIASGKCTVSHSQARTSELPSVAQRLAHLVVVSVVEAGTGFGVLRVSGRVSERVR